MLSSPSSSAKPLPSLPTSHKSLTPFWVLDDGAKIHLWKLLHSWLGHGQLQTKWAPVINDILLRILDTQQSEPSSVYDSNCNETTAPSKIMSIQVFETGSASQSKYLPGVNHGIRLQLLADLPLPLIYGGTVRLYGVPQSLQQKLIDIMAISLYTLYSLKLEADLMRDHQVLLSTNLSRPDTTIQDSHTTTNDNGGTWKYGLLGWILGKRGFKTAVGKGQNSENTSQSLLPPTINHSPKGRFSNMASRTISRKLVVSKTVNNNNNNVSSSNTPPTQQNTLTQHQYQRLRLDLEHAFISTSPSCTFTVPSIITLLEKEEEIMYTMKSVIANSQRQQQEQQRQQRERGQQKQRLIDQPLRNKLTSLARRSSSILSFGSTTEQLKSAHSNTIILPQYLTAYSMLRIPNSILNNTSKIGMDHLYLDGSSVEAFNHHQRMTINYTSYPIGCPDRPCFGPTLCTIDYFRFDDQSPYSDQTLGDTLKQWLNQCDKSCKHRIDQQALVCGGYLKKTHGSSQSLNQQQQQQQHQEQHHQQEQQQKRRRQSETIDRTPSASDNIRIDSTTTKSNQLYQRQPINTKMTIQGCRQPLEDHILCFTHGSSRIQVYFITTKSINGTTNDTHMINSTHTPPIDNNLTCWQQCTVCDARTPSKTISQQTYLFSFAKYLELCLYSTRFTGPRNDICQHAKMSSSVIAWCFGQTIEINQQQQAPNNSLATKTTEIRFVKTDIQAYRLKGSPLQVTVEQLDLPVETSSSSSSSATAPLSSLCPRISSSTLEKWKIMEGMAVDDLFRTLRQHLFYLQEHRLTQDEVEMDILSDWRTKLDLHHRYLTRVLKNCAMGNDDTSLNDFRRFFTMKASAIVDDLNGWQQTWWPSGQFFIWVGRPDYMNADINQTIHCFPDSAILVRESEPTSIIAYTLSSNEYVEELVYGQSISSEIINMVPSMQTPPPSPPTGASQTTAATSNNNNNNNNNNSSSSSNDQMHVIDGYYSSVERKYISPTTGSATETASFRTMVMETVKNNVSDIDEQHTHHRLPRWSRTNPLSPSTLSPTGKTRLLRKTERDVDLSPYPSTTDIRESTFYHNSHPAFFESQPPPKSSLDNTVTIAPTSTTASPGATCPNLPSPATDDTSTKAISPHIKHRFIHGNTEFICTVYYAEKFEALRRFCGVDQLVIESLGRCQNWFTTGGKSKSRFYKTQDDRLVIKEMVNAWNIAEKDAFLRFAPKYFDYIKASDKAPTILAKIFGFYSITIRTLNDKKQTLNLDVLVMEQLFYGQSISKTFDFKGIPERQVDEERKYQQGTTLWDNDWRKEYRLDYVTLEHSRNWMEVAIQRDTQFLASGNIMDYSLLVGIDSTKKELSVGIVDFIGAYTWYKKLESKSKSTINRSREVTVLPPDQYRTRFCREVLDYFVPIPGKFDNISLEKTNPSAWMK